MDILVIPDLIRNPRLPARQARKKIIIKERAEKDKMVSREVMDQIALKTIPSENERLMEQLNLLTPEQKAMRLHTLILSNKVFFDFVKRVYEPLTNPFSED